MKENLPKNRQYRKIFSIKMPLCLAEIYLPTHCFGTESLTGRGIHNIAYEMEDGNLVGYFCEDDIEKVGKRGLQKLLDKRFVEKRKKESFKAAFKMFNHSLWIEAQNLVNFTNDELTKLYLNQIELIRAVYKYFNLSSPAIALAVEAEIDRLLLQANISYKKAVEIKGEFLQSPEKGTPEIEEIELKKIAVKIKENKRLETLFIQKDYKEIIIALHRSFPEYDNLIECHRKRYDFLQGYVDFNRFDKMYYLSRLKEFLAVPMATLQNEIRKYESKAKEIEQERRELKRKYKLGKKLSYLLEISSYFAYHRMEMRVYYTLGLVILKKVLDEIARRMNISTEDVKWILIRENVEFLKSYKKISPKIIEERKKFSIYHIEDMKIKLKTGKEVERWRKIYLPPKDFEGVTSVKGHIGNPGVKHGYVKLILDTPDIIKEIGDMKPGSILITRNTRPDMIVACKKAAAIVTDEGGILSHAALVSREFGIPCVIATWHATKVFKDGDLVEVNADKGIVKILKRK
jgi:phosphoenolpyruvate synthase/pyruvate phosphate dikinase